VTLASPLVQLFSLLMVAGANVEVRTELRPVETKLELMVDVSQLVTDDTQTDVRRLFTDLRLRTEADDLFGLERLAFSFDGRGRIAYDGQTPHRYDVHRAFLSYGDDAEWSVGLGRIPITEIGTAQIDGARVAFGLAEGFTTSVFGGLMPHPITTAFNLDFAGGGAAYELRSSMINNAGGLVAQLYHGGLDRLYASERVYLALGRTFSLFANATVDFVSRAGVDLSNAIAVVRYRPAGFVDFSITGSHVHAILPNEWWEDWVALERARLGFSLDGPLPEGTRRSSARLVTNFHLFGFVSPYLSGRYDHRHEDAAHGWEGRAGVKLAHPTLGYADLSGAYRDYFGSRQKTGAIQLGYDGLEWFGADGGFGLLDAESAGLVYDVNLTLWGQLGPVRLTAMVQTFIEPEVVYQLFFVRLGYRFSG
jgi:hypothetical protein